MKSRESHYIRAMLTSRKTVLRKCVDLENEIRGLFKAFGIRLPKSLSHLRFDETVRPIIEANEGLSFALLPMLEARAALYVHFRDMNKRVKRVAAGDPVCNLLMTTPGVGAMTALHFKAAIDDPMRFTSSRTVAAHFGLTPRRFQSGEMDNAGHISRAGDTDVRSALYSVANSLLINTKRMSPLKAWGLKLVRQKGRKRATVAVARKLAVILLRMWIDGSRYRWMMWRSLNETLASHITTQRFVLTRTRCLWMTPNMSAVSCIYINVLNTSKSKALHTPILNMRAAAKKYKATA